jgi:hypothetical protein
MVLAASGLDGWLEGVVAAFVRAACTVAAAAHERAESVTQSAVT